MGNRFRDQLAAAVQACRIHSLTTYSWFGQRSKLRSQAAARTLPPRVTQKYLLNSLTSVFYENFFIHGAATPSGPERTIIDVSSSDKAFVGTLEVATSGRALWGGWAVHLVEGDEIVVRKGGLQLWVKRQECSIPDNDSFSPGTVIGLRLSNQLPDIAPGFFTALGVKPLDEETGLVKLYWNLAAGGAVQFVSTITTKLNRAGVPFRLKIVNHPSRFTRCDAVVIYVARTTYLINTPMLSDIYKGAAQFLRPATPAFAKELAPGLGLAEEPGNGESFGWNRCRLLAEGLVGAYEQGRKSETERVEAVEERFSAEGIRLDSPYLNLGRRDDYDVDISMVRGTERRSLRSVACETHNNFAFIEVAKKIGRRLTREAVWHKTRCTWIGSEPSRSSGERPQPSGSYSPLGPDLYSGTSGVALFLAELHKASGDEDSRRIALGATRHALDQAEVVLPELRRGLYTGWAGIAVSAARVGTSLGDCAVLERALALTKIIADTQLKQREFDILSGHAGTIVALLTLRVIFAEEEDRLIDAAISLGDTLLRSAVRSRAGYSWKSTVVPSPRNLTGFSHGAAGVGHALLELFAASRDQKYRDAALQAFGYERQWFQPLASNWPDFRGLASRCGNPGRSHRFAAAWCHGAPGIALSRLRACQLIPDGASEVEAIAGLETTRKVVEEGLRFRTSNWSLCHGIAGNGDVLLYGSQVLCEQGSKWKKVAVAAGIEGIRHYASSGQQWPCSDTSGLMLGVAGIGYFYLRLHSSDVSSLLIFRC